MIPLLLAATLAAPLRAEPGADFERALSRLRVARGDLTARPERWDTRLKTPDIEELLADPLELPERARAWGNRLGSARGLAEHNALAQGLLGTEAAPAASPALPKTLSEAVGGIASAAAWAKPLLDRAAAGLSAAERDRLAEAVLRQVRYGSPERLDPELFDLAARFDLDTLLRASHEIAAAVDAAAAALARGVPAGAQMPRSFVVAGATVTLGGPGDDEFTAQELETSTLVLDLGGRNRYLGPPAAAGPGEVRVVLDLGAESVIDSSGPVASGRFGIGVLQLGNPAGPKRLRGGPFSLGAGLFGAGLLVARGAGSRFESGDFSQGAAAFGLGVLDAEGAGTAFSAPAYAQGFGFTRGVGLLRARGRALRLDCGLIYPDPREPLATLSMCQGAGYGPRAFAAGGFGLAFVESDGAELRSNYFAQGAGYWHAFGGFYLKGNDALVQSRRYGQGAGIHTALGALALDGNGNRLLHWGVGPGFGWDWGTGHASVRGDGNRLYADWAAAKGDVNGHGLLSVAGAENRLRLGEFATGALRRAAPSYGVVTVSGKSNRIWAQGLSSATAAGAFFQPSLWGAAELAGDAVLDPSLALEGPEFRSLDAERAAAAERDRAENAARLAEADRLPASERLARWLFLAAEGGLDGRTPREALARLLSLSDAEAELLPGLVAPERFDEFIHLRTLIPAYGRRLAPALARELARASGLRKALLLGFFRQLPAAEGLPLALAARDDPDWRARGEALGALGALFDRQLGEEPGRVVFLQEALALCRRAAPRAPIDPEALARIGQKRPADLLAALALAQAPAEARVALALRAPDALSPVPPDTFHAFADILGARAQECERGLTRELEESRRLEGQAAEALTAAVERGEPLSLPAALAALGALGRAEHAALIARQLAGETAFIREAAALGLARMGPAAATAIRTALDSSDARVRELAVAAAAQSSEPEVFRLLARGFADAEEAVRLTAVAAPSGAQPPLYKLRKELVPALERLAAEDPSPSVRASAAFAAGAFR